MKKGDIEVRLKMRIKDIEALLRIVMIIEGIATHLRMVKKVENVGVHQRTLIKNILKNLKRVSESKTIGIN